MANYVTPVLNQPTDPFLKEQLDEQRRYNEALEERRRVANMEDWAVKQAAQAAYADRVEKDRREYTERINRERQELLNKQRRKDARWKHKFEKKHTDIEHDAMAAEVPEITGQLDRLDAEERAIRDEFLVSTPKAQHSRQAYDRTVSFNRRAAQRLRSEGYVVKEPMNPGTVYASTDAFTRHLAQQQQPEGVSGQDLISQYENLRASELQSIEKSNVQLGQLNNQRQALLRRQQAILDRVGGGHMDYQGMQAGVTSVPGQGGQGQMVDYSTMTPVTNPGSRYDQLAEEDWKTQNPLAAVQTADMGTTGQGRAFEGISEMDDFAKWSFDSTNDESFMNALNTEFEDPRHKLLQLQAMRDNLQAARTDVTNQTKADLKEAQEDSFNLGFRKFDPNPTQVNERLTAQEGSFGTMDTHIKNKMDETIRQLPENERPPSPWVVWQPKRPGKNPLELGKSGSSDFRYTVDTVNPVNMQPLNQRTSIVPNLSGGQQQQPIHGGGGVMVPNLSP